jgi:ectoine hydroxylase-related dioxygenase (phytanoyl-CoA dioxygenase family)
MVDPLKEDFLRQGFVVARGALAATQLQALRQHAYRASLLLLGRLGRMELAARLSSATIEQDLVELERAIPGFSVWLTINPFLTHELMQVALCESLTQLASRLLGPGRLALHPFLGVRCKVPGVGLHDVPWHQDSSYLRSLEGVDSIVTVWIPCVPTSVDNGGLQLSPSDARNSHELLHLPERDKEGSWYLKLASLPDGCAVHSVTTEPGDVVLFRHNVPHRSVPNRSSATRLSFDVRYHLEGTANGTTQPSLAVPHAGPGVRTPELLSDEALRLIEASRVRSFSYPPQALPVEPPWFNRWRAEPASPR